MNAEKIGWVVMIAVLAIVLAGIVQMFMGDLPIGGTGWATHCGGVC